MQHLLDCAGNLRLRDILPRGRFFGGSDIQFQSCCSDAASCRPGDLFVALVDADGDGHDQVHVAVRRGAVAVVAERLLPTDVPSCVTDDTREAYGKICQRLAGQPDRHLRLVGISGTYGKTTTAMLMASVLAAAERQVGVTSSLGHCDGQVTSEAGSTTPPPPELARWLARMVSNGCTDAVVEVSSEALARRQVAGLEFDAAVLTNVGRDHLDFHGSVKNYRRAKQRLLQQLKPGGFAVLNADDPATKMLIEGIDAPLITVGLHQPAELQAQLLDRCASEQTFLLTAGRESVPVRARTIGDPFIRCCLAAAAVGLVYGLDLATIVRGIESLEHVPGRLERLECGQQFGVFVDQARTPGTLAASMLALREITPGRLICVYGASQWHDADQRAALGQVGERHADVGVITSNNPGAEPPLQIAHDILDGFRHPGRAHIIPDRTKAIHWALGEAKPGDTVLISGKGHETFQVLDQQSIRFDDRIVARRWLHGRRPDPVPRHSTATLPFRLGCEWN